MTEKRHDGVKIKAVMDAFHDALEESIPNWKTLVFLDVLADSISSLQYYVKTGEKAEISWENPSIMLAYPVELAGVSPEEPQDILTKENVHALTAEMLNHFPVDGPIVALQMLTWGITVFKIEPFTDEDGQVKNCHVNLPRELQAEIDSLPEFKRQSRFHELTAGLVIDEVTKITGTCSAAPAGQETFSASLFFAIRPLTVDRGAGRAYFPVQVELHITEGDPSTWSEEDQDSIFTDLLKHIEQWAETNLEEPKPDEKPREKGKTLPLDQDNFTVAGGYVRPLFGLSKHQEDLPLLREFHEPQTPLNWAVGLALFSMTDENRVRSNDWQEVKIKNLADRVFCLTGRGASLRGDHAPDILAEVVKLHTTRNWYYEIDTVQVGRAWKKRAVLASQYAIPELQLVFLDRETGKRTFPTDAAVRALTTPLEVKGRRVHKPDGKDIPALPSDRWKLDAIRWRWVQSFNDDLLLTPALIESGKRKGLPKKTTGGKTIRKGYLIRVADNIFNALQTLRAEGSGSKYACRLLVMLASNLNKTEDGIVADRVFRMLGIPTTSHKKPEDIVAEAVVRLKAKDIRALLPGSDEIPREDPNPDRRKGPYYRFIRSPEFMPRSGIASNVHSLEDAKAIEAEYSIEETTSKPSTPPVQEEKQVALPGMEPPAIPSGAEIRAARETAGVTLRSFAKNMKGPDKGPNHDTWARYERGESVRVEKIPTETWERVSDFVEKNRPKGIK